MISLTQMGYGSRAWRQGRSRWPRAYQARRRLPTLSLTALLTALLMVTRDRVEKPHPRGLGGADPLVRAGRLVPPPPPRQQHLAGRQQADGGVGGGPGGPAHQSWRTSFS